MKPARLFAALLIALLVIAVPALAQMGGGFDLGWNTIDGGGGSSTGGGYSLFGSVGQHDSAASSGGTFDLQGGFFAVVRRPTPTPTPTVTGTDTVTVSPTFTPTASPTSTPTPSPSPTLTGAATETSTATATATATATPPPAPTLVKPKNKAIVRTRRPTLDWTDSTGAAVYEVELRKGTTAGPRVALANPSLSQLRTPNLTRGAKYFWRVRACADAGATNCGPWSAWRWFKVR